MFVFIFSEIDYSNTPHRLEALELADFMWKEFYEILKDMN
jgi:hypothetical protein